MIKPYIGVTGFTIRSQVEQVQSLFTSDSSRLLMVGILMSQKTAMGGKNKYRSGYPGGIWEIERIFTDYPFCLNLIHYHTDEIYTLDRQLSVMAELAGPNLHGFQINNPWPPVFTLENFRIGYPDLKIILQVSGELSAHELTSNMARYDDYVDAYLLDKSRGFGKLLGVREVSETLWDMGRSGSCVGIAGGLNFETLDQIAPLLMDFPDLSTDTQSGVLNQEGFLDIEMAKRYLKKHLALVDSCPVQN